MQQVLRPYATAGVALVGAGVIALSPLAVLPSVQTRPVQLVDAWSDLLTDTITNLQNIDAGADSTAISSVYSDLLTNPLGVIEAFANLTPTVTSDLTTLPGQISVDLTPGLELAIAQLGADAAALNAVSDVVSELSSNPSGAFSTLLEAPATILNGYLNGEDNISLLNGTIDFTGFNGILAPLQDVSINLNLVDLLDALGLGDTSLSNLDLSSLLGITNLGDLFSALGISDDGLGTLLGDPSLSTLLGDLGLSNLGLGSFSLTSILSDLGLDGNVNLDDLSLNTVLSAFGIDPTVNLGLGTALTDLGFGSFVNEDLGTLLASLPSSDVTDIVSSLNGALGTLIDDNAILAAAFEAAGIGSGTLVTASSLESALNTVTVDDLLGGQSIDATVSTLLTDLGVTVPDTLTVGGILTDLGFSGSTGDLTLSGLLSDLGVDDTSVTSLLNSVDLGTLLNDLGLSALPLDLSNLGDLSDLTLSGLLGDLGLNGDVATISIDGIGGFDTLLADVVPQQILAALGM